MEGKMKKLLLLGSIVSLFAFNNAEVKAAEKVDLIVKNGIVLTMNGEKEILDDGVVIVKGNKIIEVGDKKILKKYSSKKTIDADGGIIMPGMINQEMVYTGAIHGSIEMAKGGVTTMVDMYLFEESAAQAVKEIGLRGIMTQNIIKYPTADGKDGDAKVEMAIAFVEKYKNDELITPGFGPHAPHTVKQEDLERIRDLSKKYNVPVSMHVAETQKEFDNFKAKYNMTPVEYLDSIGLLNERFIAAHSIFVTDSDIELMKKRDIGVAHNMVANIKSAKGVSPALKMYDEGLRIGLGTDGPMSGNTLDIIGQMGYVAKLHKLENKDRSAMPPYKVVDMATMGGARAIHMEDKLGSLEKGKLADIVVLETKSANMQPIFDPYSVLVYSANASNVETVIVNGKMIIEDKKLLTYDEEKNRKAVQEFSKKVKKIAESL
jgi:cytosine/adenosine deaminase-related metal-dependent hydrolase